MGENERKLRDRDRDEREKGRTERVDERKGRERDAAETAGGAGVAPRWTGPRRSTVAVGRRPHVGLGFAHAAME